ncbi:MAG: hypothetical protein WDM80_03385 [Limisphaerales bacterium]
MKKLFQLNFLLLLISSATAQESSPHTPAPQQPTKVLRVYDWNELAQQHQLPDGEVIEIDGMAVLKIESTNNPPSEDNFGGYRLDAPFKASILKITNSVIKNRAWVACEFKYENVWSGMVVNTNREVRNKSGTLKLVEYYPPSASGGDERIDVADFNFFNFAGKSNWQLYRFEVGRNESGELPSKLELKLSLAGHGTVYIRPIKLLGVTSSWWSPQQADLMGGVGGSIIGCFGALLGILASKGKARHFVLTTTKIFIGLGILLTIAGLVAVVSKQPYAVWYALLLPGVILTLVFSLNLHSIQRRYDELEIRRMTSVDTMGS